MGKNPVLNVRMIFLRLWLPLIIVMFGGTVASADLAVGGTIATGGWPGESVAISQSINLQYYMTAPYDGMLVIYDDFSNSTQTVLLDLGNSKPWDLDVYENGGSPKLYISDKDNFRVFVYNVLSATVTTTFPVGNTPLGVAVDNTRSKVYICGYNSNYVSVYNTAADTFIGLIGQLDGMTKPYGVAVNETTDRVYVSSYDTGYIFVYESSTGNYVTKIQALAKPTNIAVNEIDNKVYIVHDGLNYVTVIDGLSETADAITIPSWGQDVAYLPDLGIYFVVMPAANKLYGFDAEDDTEIVDSPLDLGFGSTPHGIAVREDGINGGSEPWVLVTANLGNMTMSEVSMNDTYDPKFTGLTSVVDAGDGVTPTITLNWSAASDISPPITYNVYTTATSGVYTFSTPTWTTLSSGAVAYTNGINYGDHLYFVVRAQDSSAAVNEDENVVEFDAIATDGAAPTGGDLLTAVDTGQGKEVQLTWSAGVDTTLPITYNIYRTTTSGVYNWLSPTYSTETVTSYTINGLANDTMYYFTVRAEDGAGLENSNSTQIAVTPTDSVPPTFAGIINLADDMTGGALNMTWYIASDNSEPITYNIYYEAGATVTSYVTPGMSVSNVPSAQLTGLTNDTGYTVVVRAEDTAGNEDGNFVSKFATPTDVIPPVFGGVLTCQDKGNSDEIRLTWQAATDNSLPITYDVYYATQSGAINYNFASWSYQTSALDYVATGLSQGQDYYFIVHAEDGSGLEDANVVEAGPCSPTDGADPVFSGIQSATATWVSGEVLLSWTAATDDSPPIIYNIYQSGISGGQNYSSATYQTTNASYTVSGLSDGSKYYYVVRAQDMGLREDNNTTQLSATPNDGVAPVFAGVTGVTDAGTYGALDISWGAATDSNPPITYRVYVAPATGTLNYSSPKKTTTATSTQITGLNNGQVYDVVVRASDAGGLTETNVVELSATPSDLTGPTFAGLVSVTDTGSGGKLNLVWSSATDPSEPITYPVYMSVGTSTIDYSTPVYIAQSSPYSVTGLSGSQTYYFSVGAKDGAAVPNIATNAVVFSGVPTDVTAPSFPLGLKSAVSTPAQSQSVTLSWDAASDYSTPVTYSIYYSSSNIAALIISGGIKATTTQTSYIVTGLTNGVFEYFIVRAKDVYGNKESNLIVKGAVPSDWSVPVFSGLETATNTGKGGEVQLGWSAAVDETVVSYNIYYSNSTSTLMDTIRKTQTGLGYTVTGLTNNSLYYFAVGAEDLSGNETTNDIIFATTPTDISAPVFGIAPSVQDTTVGGEVAVSWGAATDNSGPVMYNIYQSLSTSTFTFGTPTYSTQNVTSYTIPGLVDDQPYSFVVTAEDSSTNSNESSTATVLTATPSDQTAPDFSGIGSVTYYTENGIVLLSWSAATDRTEPVTYNIFKTSTAGSYGGYASANYVVSGTTTYLVSGLLDTKRYYFTVRAQDAVMPTPNKDANTTEKAITFRDVDGPEQVADVAAIGGDISPATNDQYIQISWTPPTRNADALGTDLVDLKGYNIYRGTLPGSYDIQVNQVDGVLNGLVPAASSTYTDTYNLTDNVMYYYIIIAVDDAAVVNESAPSTEVSAKTKNSDIAIPRSPENLSATPADGQVTLTWTAPEFNEDGSPLTDLLGFYLWRSESSGGVYLSIGGLISDTATAYLDTAVVNDTTYYYYMTAVDGGGEESANSLEVSAKPATSIDYPPSAPTSLVATTGDAVVYLSWSAPTTNTDGSAIAGDLAGYNVFRADGSSTQSAQLNSSIVTSASYNDGTVVSGIQYTYYVVAEDNAGQKSATSTEAIAIIGTKGVTGRIRVRVKTTINSSGYPLQGVALLEVQLVDDTGTVVASGFTSSDGTFKIVYEEASPSIAYSVRLVVKGGTGYPYNVKVDENTGYLTLVKEIFISNGFTNMVPEPAPIGTVTTLGDINCDGMINLSDVSAMKLSYGRSIGDQEYDIKADITGDGAVNLSDLSAMKAHFGQETMSVLPGTCN